MWNIAPSVLADFPKLFPMFIFDGSNLLKFDRPVTALKTLSERCQDSLGRVEVGSGITGYIYIDDEG